MDSMSMAKSITRTVLAALVLAVVGFSLLLAPEINARQIAFALGKGLLTMIFGWIFILILTDTIVRSIASSALEARASRREGGILFHFLKPEPNEIADGGGGPTRKPVAESQHE